MLFELRNSVEEVSSRWIEARDLFLAGRCRAAWEIADARRKSPCLEIANDYLLNIEIARACSANRTYLALVRRGIKAFPSDPFLQLYHARVLLTRNRHMLGVDYLKSLEGTLGKTHHTLWAAELANLYGSAGFTATCKRWLESISDEPDNATPLALYSQACSNEGMQEWDAAIQLARRCVDAAPDWSRARTYYSHCLLARGRIDEAEEQLREAEQRGHEEATLDIAVGMLTMSLGRFDEARTRLEGLLENWPQADFAKWVKRMLCVLLVEMGDNDAAREIADGNEKEMALPKVPKKPSGSHAFIPLPLVAQNRNQCVPTTVAMAAWPQGRKFDADDLFREMHGREGTRLWRMRQWVEEHGFVLVPVQLEKDAIVELLDFGIPLVGALEGPFNSHVDVICGYREDLDVLYVRDPEHWAVVAWPWELALGRYRMHNGVMAIVDATREDVLTAAKQWLSTDTQALLDLNRAIAHGKLDEAEAAFNRIDDDSPAASMRDGHSVGVVISPPKFFERMKGLIDDEEANPIARFRAMMTLGSDDIEELMEKLLAEQDGNRYGIGVRRYLTLLRMMGHGDWRKAQDLVEKLLLSGGGISAFWELKSDILAELGQQDASREALDRAIELEPLRMSLREKSLNRSASRLTFAEYLQEFDSLLAEDPDDKRLLVGRALALQEGPDGAAYEQAVREAIRWFPRDPRGYFDLMSWYRIQRRDDLADELLEEAKRMAPDVFDQEDEGESAKKEEQGDENTHVPLPEDKDALVEFLWSGNPDQRPAALSNLLELEQEGQLKWYQRARVLSYRLLVPDDPDANEIDAAALLPDEAPGAAHWFVLAVCEPLTANDPSIRVALSVNDWIEKVVDEPRNYPEIWFERVLLLEHGRQLERALDELRQLLERYPAYSSALYRMGVVKYRQEDYHGAREFFQRALQVNPGLLGAVEMLRRGHDLLGNQKESLECTRRLREKFPYAFEYFGDEVLVVTEMESLSKGLKIIEADAEKFQPKPVAILRARAHLVANQIDQAAAALERLEISDDEENEDILEDYLQLELSIATQRNDRREVLEICERGLKRWPHSTRLKEIKAEHLEDTDPEQSRDLLRDVLCEGEPQPQTAWQYLTVSNEPADRAARKVILKAAEDRQLALAELFSEVMGHSALVQWNAAYLEWALGKFPASDQLRYRLAMHYNINGQSRKAVQLARQLHEQNPENPEAARMFGRCLIDQDVDKALTVLERVCRENRSSDYLFDLARCHQIAGNANKSRDLHWEILEQNPYLTSSWTNLFLLDGPHDRLWPYLPPMIQRGYGVDDEYFLVAAVLISVERNERLPVEWLPLALQRWQILKTLPGFHDERSRLLRALLAWRRVRPHEFDAASGVPKSFVQSLLARFRWPRLSWVPRD
jgi:tetratricopeptide (TPR) repeat protein